MLDEYPEVDADFVANDRMAQGALPTDLRDRGRRVPHVAVVGFSDRRATDCRPMLTDDPPAGRGDGGRDDPGLRPDRQPGPAEASRISIPYRGAPVGLTSHSSIAPPMARKWSRKVRAGFCVRRARKASNSS